LPELGITRVDGRSVERFSNKVGRQGILKLLEVKSVELLLAVSGREGIH